jgi:DNA replication protein DnaC
LWGDNGHGKSYISAALCKRVWGELRVTSYYITASELRDSFLPGGDRPANLDSFESVVQRVGSVRFLVIDDIGKEHRASSGFAENKFGKLVRDRVRDNLVTCLTTNLNPKEFGEVYGRSTGQLIKECMIPVKIVGDDMRNVKFREIRSKSHEYCEE